MYIKIYDSKDLSGGCKGGFVMNSAKHDSKSPDVNMPGSCNVIGTLTTRL